MRKTPSIKERQCLDRDADVQKPVLHHAGFPRNSAAERTPSPQPKTSRRRVGVGGDIVVNLKKTILIYSTCCKAQLLHSLKTRKPKLPKTKTQKISV